MTFIVYHIRDGFNTQPPEGGWRCQTGNNRLLQSRFNTQPPEGGWCSPRQMTLLSKRFNTQPPEGGWR